MKRIGIGTVVGLLTAASVRAADEEPLLGGSILEIVDKGGIVMIAILVGSVIGVALALERLVSLRVRRLVPKTFVEDIRTAADHGRTSDIARLATSAKHPLARILAAGMRHVDDGAHAMERTMENVGRNEVARLRRPVRPLAILASVTPLLGLLGTILGMIATFNLLGETSPADRVETLAPGIGKALYTTAAGLTVAIPFVLMYHFLNGRINRAAEEWSLLGTDVVAGCRDQAITSEAA